MERFSCKTQVISGDGALEALGDLTGKRLLIIRDGLELSERIAQQIRGMIKPETEAFFDKVTPEPTMQQAVEGVRQIRTFRPDLMVAAGGSHVIECAKAMACFSGKQCPLAVVPTWLGSGAEVTGSVTLTHNGCRHFFQNPAMRPDMAILDSSFLTDNTPGSIAEGGFAILADSLQAFMGKSNGMLAGLHAREAFCVCWGALPAAFAGNQNARRRLQTASVMTGIACDSLGSGLCRAMGDSLGSLFHLSAGNLGAILLPAVVSCNAHAAGKRLAELSRAAGLGGSSEAVGVRNLKTALIRLRRELGMPPTLTRAGVNPRWVWSNVGRIVELTLEHPECRNNPVTVDDFLVRRILEEITGHY